MEEAGAQRELRQRAEAQVLKLEADLVFMRKDGEEQERELRQLRKELEAQRATAEDLQSKLDGAEARLKDAERRITEGEEAMAAQELIHAKVAKERDAEVTREVQNAAATAVMLQHQIRERDSAISALQGERAEMLGQLQQDALAIAELDRELHQLTDCVQASEERAEVLEKEAADQKSLRREVEALLDVVEKESRSLEERLADADSRAAAAEARAEAAREEAAHRADEARGEAERRVEQAREQGAREAKEARQAALEEGSEAVKECMGAVLELEGELRALMAHVEAQASLGRNFNSAALATGVWELQAIPEDFRQVGFWMMRRSQECQDAMESTARLQDRIIALEEEVHLLRLQRDNLMQKLCPQGMNGGYGRDPGGGYGAPPPAYPYSHSQPHPYMRHGPR